MAIPSQQNYNWCESGPVALSERDGHSVPVCIQVRILHLFFCPKSFESINRYLLITVTIYFCIEGLKPSLVVHPNPMIKHRWSV